MKFTIEAQSLAAAMKRVSLVVERRASVPILSQVLLTVEGNLLTLYGTDLDMSIADTAAVHGTEDGAATVEAKALASLATGADKGSFVEIESGDDGVTIRNGRSSSTLRGLPVTDMPHMKDKARPARFTLPGAILAAEIAKVRHAISSEETRYYLNGIYWHRHEGVLRMVATDGHRLALSDTPAPHGTEAMPGVIVPVRTVDVLRKLTAGKHPLPVEAEIGDTQLRFTIGETVLMSKIIDGTFPEYRRVIPKSNGIIVEFDRKEALAAIGRLVKMTSDHAHAVKFDAVQGDVTLSVTDYNANATTTASIDASVNKPITAGFNGRYLTDMLGSLSGESVAFHFSDNASPMVVAENGAQHVLMPMRV